MNNFVHPELFLNLNNPHPLISKENSYQLSKKYLSIHANDRDIQYFPNSNEFSIKCPQSYINVQSIKLNEISFPNPIFNFSNNLKNNSFYIRCEPSNNILITIPDGFYTPDDLAKKMQDLINSNNFDSSFNIKFLKNESKFSITNKNSFMISSKNDISCNNNYIYNYKKTYKNLTLLDENLLLKLDFLYSIGFDFTNKNVVTSIKNDEDYKLISNSCIRFRNTEPIYLEIDKYNIYDELNPFPKGTSNMFNNFSNTSINTAFFKLTPLSNDFSLSNFNIISSDSPNIFFCFNPPLQRLQNLKFKFRYHDGTLVDLQTQDVNFTLEFNQLLNEIPKQINIRNPY